MTDNLTSFTPDWVSPPGETMVDLLEEKGWTQAELATRTGFTRKHVNELVAGKAVLTPDAALRLEATLGGSASFWLTREAHYRERRARLSAADELRASATWLGELPLTDMVKFGWVARRRDRGAQVLECLRFFGVASVEVWREKYERAIAVFRATPRENRKLGAIAAWLRRGEQKATEIDCKPYSGPAFRRALPGLRALTREADPDVFVPRLMESCRDCGVAVVFVPTPSGCPVSGATRWLAPTKALLQLSLRYKSNDSLWFTLFHEAGHVLLHGKKMLFLEDGESSNQLENEANLFATNALIDPQDARELFTLQRSRAAVITFANRIGVAPGIVVGRMQNEKLLPWSHLNGLKVRYQWGDGRT